MRTKMARLPLRTPFETFDFVYPPAKRQPSAQFVTTDPMGALAVFLCSNGTAQIRGMAWNVDGGWYAPKSCGVRPASRGSYTDTGTTLTETLTLCVPPPRMTPLNGITSP